TNAGSSVTREANPMGISRPNSSPVVCELFSKRGRLSHGWIPGSRITNNATYGHSFRFLRARYQSATVYASGHAHRAFKFQTTSSNKMPRSHTAPFALGQAGKAHSNILVSCALVPSCL